MADTAALLVNGDHIDEYLANGGQSEEFLQTKQNLDTYCKSMNVSIVYVIKVDTSDFGRFTSVFNSVGDNTPYTPWEIGYQQNTTNDTYEKLYAQIYAGELPYGTVFRITHLNGAPPHITTLVPIKNSQGDVVSLMCIQRAMSELKDGTRPYLINIAFSTIILSVIVSFTSAIYIRKNFVNPVRSVINEAHRFASENTKGASLGNISKINEISDLALSIDKMEDDIQIPSFEKLKA